MTSTRTCRRCCAIRPPPRTSRRSHSSGPTGAGGRSIDAAVRSERGCSVSLGTRRSTSFAGAEDVTEQDAGDDAEVALRRTTVQTALAKLPAREREIVALKFHAGMSNAELARVLGISESNAGTLLYRTMEKLRKACNATA
jgi:RNA polymerase sigma factor (sigma-70 family)